MENGYARTSDLAEYDLTFDQQYHGRNIKVEEGGKMAHKIKKGAKEALVVTNRPLVSNELFEIEVGGGHGFKGVKGEMKAMLKGKESVRIGVTVHCPSDISSYSAQHSLKRMSSGTWMMMSESIIESGDTIKSFQKYNLKEIALGDRVGIVRVPEFNGSLIIYINGAPIGIMATGVPDKVYGFIELQGECERIGLSRNKIVQHEALPIEIRSMRERAAEIVKLQKQLNEKEELVQVLDNQLELLRKQLMAIKTRPGGSLNTSITDTRENRETQTSQVSSNNIDTQSNSSNSRRRRKTGACCTIS